MNKMTSLKNKIAVVTGGTGVLGSNVSEGLLQASATVIIVGSRQETVDKALAKLEPTAKANGTTVTGFVCNVLNHEEIVALTEKVKKQFGRVDILVNAAGGNVAGANIMDDMNVYECDMEALKKVVDLNLWGTVYPCLSFGKIMAEQKSGSIINVSSMAAYDALSRVMGYSIAKEGVNALTKWLAQDFARKYGDKIRVNAIAPGFFIGEQNRKALLNDDGSLTERSHKVLNKTPMGRFGDISELNGIVRFLASDEASFVTGTIIPVDGGFSSFAGV
ncbi:MAG: SDR family oxidoreductase [Bacteroidales bacterium]|nr:SDR family oxidoreductase [Bacteroidales bacterium]